MLHLRPKVLLCGIGAIISSTLIARSVWPQLKEIPILGFLIRRIPNLTENHRGTSTYTLVQVISGDFPQQFGDHPLAKSVFKDASKSLSTASLASQKVEVANTGRRYGYGDTLGVDVRAYCKVALIGGAVLLTFTGPGAAVINLGVVSRGANFGCEFLHLFPIIIEKHYQSVHGFPSDKDQFYLHFQTFYPTHLSVWTADALVSTSLKIGIVDVIGTLFFHQLGLTKDLRAIVWPLVLSAGEIFLGSNYPYFKNYNMGIYKRAATDRQTSALVQLGTAVFVGQALLDYLIDPDIFLISNREATLFGGVAITACFFNRKISDAAVIMATQFIGTYAIDFATSMVLTSVAKPFQDGSREATLYIQDQGGKCGFWYGMCSTIKLADSCDTVLSDARAQLATNSTISETTCGSCYALASAITAQVPTCSVMLNEVLLIGQNDTHAQL